MVPALTDEVLMAAQKGDSAACSHIYKELSPGVLGYLKAKGADDVEAVTQEVFLAVFAKLNNVKDVQGLRVFAFSIAHARVVDETRRRSRRPAMAEYEPTTDARTTESAEDAALAAFAGDRVEQLLQQLSVEQREVLSLRIVAGLSTDQVAEIMEKSPGAIKQLQRRSLAKLKGLLAGRDSEE